MRHLDIISTIEGDLTMAQIGELEAQAIMEASEEIGAHLEALGKTDIATMTYEEWCDFLAHAFSAISDRIEAGIPF